MSGATSERATTWTYGSVSVLISGFVYPVVTHWAWSDRGWLHYGDGNGIGYRDFAGSGVVHVVGGTASLCAVYLLGPRMGRFVDGKPSRSIASHSIPLVTLGGSTYPWC